MKNYNGAFRVKNWQGIAFHIIGPAEREGDVRVVMIGDDRVFEVDQDDCSPMNESEYCGVCGQIGCHCNY